VPEALLADFRQSYRKAQEGNMEHLPAYVKILSYLFVVVYMLSVTLETTHSQMVATLRDGRLMRGALVANLLLVPVLGVLLGRWLDLPPEIMAGFLMLALTPGGLFALQFARFSQGNRVLAVVLLIVLSMVAVVVTPVLMHLFFPTAAGKVPFAWLMFLLLLLLAAPLCAGRAFQLLAPAAAPKLGRLLDGLSIVLFIIVTLTTGKDKMPAIKALGTHGIVAMIALTLGAWAVGWLLGGPELRNRKVLAISTSMRNVGICLPIAAHYFSGTEVIVPILAFSGIAIPLNMLFALITGRPLRDPEARVGPGVNGSEVVAAISDPRPPGSRPRVPGVGRRDRATGTIAHVAHTHERNGTHGQRTLRWWAASPAAAVTRPDHARRAAAGLAGRPHGAGGVGAAGRVGRRPGPRPVGRPGGSLASGLRGPRALADRGAAVHSRGVGLPATPGEHSASLSRRRARDGDGPPPL
jgi:BASS family bile acid:Na+ symporter